MKFSKRVLAILGLAPLLAGVATIGSCQTPPPVSKTHIKTVFIILMENKNCVQIAGSGSAPYINNTLLPMPICTQFLFSMCMMKTVFMRSEEHTSELQSPDHIVCR